MFVSVALLPTCFRWYSFVMFRCLIALNLSATMFSSFPFLTPVSSILPHKNGAGNGLTSFRKDPFEIAGFVYLSGHYPQAYASFAYSTLDIGRKRMFG